MDKDKKPSHATVPLRAKEISGGRSRYQMMGGGGMSSRFQHGAGSVARERRRVCEEGKGKGSKNMGKEGEFEEGKGKGSKYKGKERE